MSLSTTIIPMKVSSFFSYVPNENLYEDIFIYFRLGIIFLDAYQIIHSWHILESSAKDMAATKFSRKING